MTSSLSIIENMVFQDLLPPLERLIQRARTESSLFGDSNPEHAILRIGSLLLPHFRTTLTELADDFYRSRTTYPTELPVLLVDGKWERIRAYATLTVRFGLQTTPTIGMASGSRENEAVWAPRRIFVLQLLPTENLLYTGLWDPTVEWSASPSRLYPLIDQPPPENNNINGSTSTPR
jgi:hypothetical protein